MGYEEGEESTVPYEQLQGDNFEDEDLESGSHRSQQHPRHGSSSYQQHVVGDENTINPEAPSATTVMEHELDADKIVSASDDSSRETTTAQTSLVQHSQSEDLGQPPVVTMGAKSNRPGSQQQQQRLLSKRLMMVNVLANFLMFAIAGFITYHCFNKATVLFSWHPSFMSVGYLILMSQAVLTLSGANILTYKKHHKTRVFIHWLLQALAGILITVAFVCIVLNKIRMDKPHFQTWHGLLGLITVILTLASIGGGVFTKYGFQLRHLMRPIYSKIVHGIAGTITYVMGSVTIGFGIYSRWFQEDNDSQTRLALLLGLIAVSLYIIINPIAATISRTKTALRSAL
ncbi:probable transmembrane reductase CYB561D1 [Uranotaenia lowii]|uniref:probable transmembrane reductase CYB561D1 n=1 Tax=Uranotaenia lowii TaxID=190385 RepID=UPI0024788A9D|nr:probable transmembrane reductase CYB561D1 [Uranotaenia lowii]